VRFFVDANVVIYAAAAGPHHESCAALLTAVAEGRVEGRTSTAVLEEVWHLELSGRLGDVGGMTADAYRIFTPLLPVTDPVLRVALASPGHGLGTNDRIHVATCAAEGLDAILTADRRFDSVPRLRRLDPLDDRAMAELLG
jgi:predicted nucleic acid-binding protein